MAENDESGEESARSAQVIRQLRGFSAAAGGARARSRSGASFCGQLLPARHSHVVHIERRNLLCACRPCFLLFSSAGAAGGKVKAVPEEVFDLGEGVFSQAQWTGCRSRSISRSSSSTALSAAPWFSIPARREPPSRCCRSNVEELVREHPRLATLSQDVEALLAWQRSETSDQPSAAFIVPIDACYELVGIVRRTWKGFHGGEEAWQAIAAFFSALRARASTA